MLTRNNIRLTLEGARAVLAAAESKAREIKVPQNIAIVDEGGHLLVFVRMDRAKLSSIEVALTKARAAALRRSPTGPSPSTPSPASCFPWVCLGDRWEAHLHPWRLAVGGGRPMHRWHRSECRHRGTGRRSGTGRRGGSGQTLMTQAAQSAWSSELDYSPGKSWPSRFFSAPWRPWICAPPCLPS